MDEHVYILQTDKGYYQGVYASLMAAQREVEKKKEFNQNYSYKITIEGVRK